MAIYRMGAEVTMCDARMIPVWTIRTPGTYDWKYEKPKKTPKGSKVEEKPMWHYRGWYTDSGAPICDNKWVDAYSLRADEGWKEVEARLLELCPDAEERWEQWNKSGAPEASHFFPPIFENEAA